LFGSSVSIVWKFGLSGAFMALSIAFILCDLFFFVLVNSLIRKIVLAFAMVHRFVWI
jgi:hypothetical protein